MTVAIINLKKISTIKKKGVSADGIIFDLTSTANTSMKFQLPIIRFLTKEETWVTEEAKIGLPYGIYKKGQKVKVLYNRDQPKEFFIVSLVTLVILYGFLIVGIILLTISLINIKL